MLAFLPVVLDMTILHVAIPTLTQSLGAFGTEVLWIIDIYPLLMAGLLVPMGTLSDRVGKRRIMLIGLVIFALASAWASVAQSAAALIAARVLLALGGSMIIPCVLGLIRNTFEDDNERAMALGLWGMVAASGAAIGPLVGGALLAHFWWGSVFLINVPVMLVVGPACYFLLPRNEPTTPGKWAIGQALLLILGMISLVYGIKAGVAGKHAPAIIGFVILFGALILTLFVYKQLKSPAPMLDLSLLTNPAIFSGLLMAMVVSGALAGVELTLAQELQYVLDKTPLLAGIFMIPLMAAAAIGGPAAGFLSNRLGLRLVATLSLAISAIALVLLGQSDFHQPGFLVPFALAVLGLALSIGLTTSSIAIMKAADPRKSGAAGSLEATGYELGTGLGITFFGVFMSSMFRRAIELPSDLPQAMAEQASRTIGDTYIVAEQLAGPQGAALIEAGKLAFTKTHTALLTTAATGIGLLAIVVFFTLASYRKPPETRAG